MAKEARIIRRDILSPLVRMRFGDDMPVPFFKRVMETQRDLRQLADVLKVAVNDLRMKVPSEWAHQALGVPVAGEGESLLSGNEAVPS